MEGTKSEGPNDKIVSAAKRRKSRWGVVAGGELHSAEPSSPVENFKSEGTSNSVGAVKAPPAPSVNVQDILKRIGDVSSILSRARALKEASLVPKHATLKINKSLLDGKSNKHEVASTFVDSRLKTRIDSRRPGAFKFINKGYFISKQKNLEKRLEERGVDVKVISKVMETLDAGREHSPKSDALNALQEFLGRDRRRKHVRSVPMSYERLQTRKTDTTEIETDEHSDRSLLWWDREVLKELSFEEREIRDAKLKLDLADLATHPDGAWKAALAVATMSTPYAVKDGAINHLIEHPEPLEPLIDTNADSGVAPIYLTRSERKRMRRQLNKEREQDKRDKIQMGLMEPPPPKVKLSNLMRVLGDTAASKPTTVEASVRKQIAERQKAHEDRIAASRLTDEARRAKKIRQWVVPKETEEQVAVAIFSVKDIPSKQCLFKVHQNAKDLHLTGAAALCPGERNIVLVEGSAKAVKKYKAVMLRRIQWPGATDVAKDVITASESGGDILDPFCVVIWEGPVKTRSFRHWNTYPCSSLLEMEELFNKNNADQYWKTIIRFRPAQADLLC